VQGLRAVAVLAVVIYHAGIPLPGGFTGVDVFFVISGYVITLMLLREWGRDGRISLGAFYLRRFKRLVPALAVMVSATLLVSLFFLPPLGEDNRVLYTAAAALLFAANIVIDVLSGDYFAARSQSNPLLHTWTLAVEEQFYLGFPLLLVLGLVLLGRYIGARRGALILIATATVVSFSLAVIASSADLPIGESLLGFYSPISRAWEFGVGALLAFAEPALKKIPPALGSILGVLGLLSLAASFTLISSATPFPGTWTLLPVLGTAALLIAGVATPHGIITRGISGRFLGWVGDLSYSLYLWHWPVIVIVTLTWPDSNTVAALAALASVIPAAASFYLIERRFRHVDTPTSRSVVWFIARVLWLPVLTWIAAWWVASRVVAPFVRDEIGQPTLDNIAIETECITEEGFSMEWAQSCVWGEDRPGKPIYLIGDSNAAHFSESVLGAAEIYNRPVTIITAPSCIPLRDMTVTYEDGSEVFTWCSSYNAFTYDFLKQAPPGTIVLAFYDVLSWSDDRHYLARGELSSGSEEKAKTLERELLRDTEGLSEIGHDFVFVHTVPQFRTPGPSFEPRECNLLDLVNDQCARDVLINTLDQTQRFNREALEAVASARQAPLIDPRDELCDEDSCSTGDDGFITYRDDIHISVAEAKRMIPYFDRALAPQ
jgi:peptidoglycan/LPS O-acetylase OafA/YrhL